MSPQRLQVQGDLFHGVVPEGAVYIGRAAPGLPASPYANPFPVKTFGLDISLESYDKYLRKHPTLVQRAVEEIGDSDMACWCKPGARCHGDLLRAAMVRALDRIPETPAIDTREDIKRRLDEARADFLGRRVREVWVGWASKQPDAKDSWLVGWDDLDEGQREVDRLIGLELAKLGRSEADNAITWFTTCLNCSTLLDSAYAETVRAEKAEWELAKYRAALIDMLNLSGELINLYWVPKEERADRMPLADQHRQRAERARLVLGETEG